MKIDINCDLGEGLPNDADLMRYISSCNIACGGHVGTAETIDKTIALAKKNNVKIGAHPSFPDKENFGRKVLKISSNELQKSIENQLQLFVERLKLQKAKLHHIKAHGALYNASAKDKNIAEIIVKAIKSTKKDMFLYVPFNSEIEKIAQKNNINIKYEAFIDRNYNDDFSLVSRNQKDAVITCKKEAFKHLLLMINNKQVHTISQKNIPIKADTFCIHGDNENAIELLQYIKKELLKKGITIC